MFSCFLLFNPDHPKTIALLLMKYLSEFSSVNSTKVKTPSTLSLWPCTRELSHVYLYKVPTQHKITI